LIKKLYGIKDPKTGEGVVKQVLTAREAFGAELTAEAPDLVVRLKEGYIAVPHIELRQGQLFESREPGQDYQIGVHHPEGIIMAKGSMIRQGWNRLEADIIDIVPTLLYHLDLPIPTYLDGKILRELYNPESEFLKGKEPQFIEDVGVGVGEGQGLSEDEEEQIRKHLQDLGYLD
jgi:predicted AlkP superfamily phosphohydrolase/phosphomutase